MSLMLPQLKRKMHYIQDLQSVVRSMKALAASNIKQYQDACVAMTEYSQTIHTSLSLCISQSADIAWPLPSANSPIQHRCTLAFGSQHGLVGQFNQDVCRACSVDLSPLLKNHRIWAIGDLIAASFSRRHIQIDKKFTQANSIAEVDTLVSEILLAIENLMTLHQFTEVILVYNQLDAASGLTTHNHKLLPLEPDTIKFEDATPWPSTCIPQILNAPAKTFSGLVQEYLYVSLYRACVESLASENADRLASMTRAENNIAEKLDELHSQYCEQRQTNIDEELHDLFGGYEALN